MCDYSFRKSRGNSEQFLSVRNNFHTSQSSKHLSDNICKSDMNVVATKKRIEIPNLLNFREYYKNYEHDALPVKDSSLYATSNSDKASLTNSDIDKFETNILKNTSQELEINKNPVCNLESHIKFFKITVQEIFDNFYTSMQDFELYKKRFHEILEKNQEEAVADMEDFIKDTIQHIMSSESSISNGISQSSNIKSNSSKALHDNNKNDESIISNKHENNKIYIKNPEETIAKNFNLKSSDGNLQKVVEAYKNFDYTTDSTVDDNKIEKINSDTTKDEALNIYLSSKTPHVQIKMTDRNLLSEINIREPSNAVDDCKYVASAENVKKLAAKKKELEQYVQEEQNYDISSDRDIPVKVSYAKRNIHIDEELNHEHESESFISKLCNFICKKFRKS